MNEAFFKNAVRERWVHREVAIATTLRQLRGPDAAYIVAACGFDALVVDCEHATYSMAESSAIFLSTALLVAHADIITASAAADRTLV